MGENIHIKCAAGYVRQTLTKSFLPTYSLISRQAEIVAAWSKTLSAKQMVPRNYIPHLPFLDYLHTLCDQTLAQL